MKLGVSKYRNDNGVSCYVNSILHILQQTPIFSDWLFTKDLNPNNKITYEMARLFRLSCTNDNIIITPSTFKRCVGERDDIWLEHQQQDSQEYLTFILSEIDDEYIAENKTKKLEFIPGVNKYSDIDKIDPSDIYKLIGSLNKKCSIIKELFFGSISSNIKCEYCSTGSSSFEEFSTLSIDIPSEDDEKQSFSLEDCLKNTFSDEQLDEHNKSYCEFCGIKNKGFKKNSIWKPPHILIIHLKRFKFTAGAAKNTNVINYPINDLDMSKYIDVNSPYIDVNSKYDLFGVNIHEEFGYKSINAGHYTSIVLNRYDSKFYLFNDSREAIKLNKKDVQNDNAYLLFYIKK